MNPRRQVRALAAAVALLAAACGSDGGTATTTTSSTETTTTTTLAGATTTTAPGQQISVLDLGLGMCFEERLAPGQGETPIDATFRIDCALPHDNEVYHVAQLPQPVGEPFPGEEEVGEFAYDECLGAFAEFVGVDYVNSVLEIGHLVPTEESWDFPDRDVVCFVFHREGTKLTGSVQGTAQ